MKKLIILALALVAVVFISGCVQEKTELYEMNKTSPEVRFISLTVYGRLVDYSQNDNVVFEINSEIVNCERNVSYLRLETRPTKNYNFSKVYRCLDQMTEEQCKDFLNKLKSAIYQEYNLSQNCRKTTEIPERGDLYIKCDVNFDLVVGENYVFYFTKMNENEEFWSGARVDQDFNVSDCYYNHEYDIIFWFIQKPKFGDYYYPPVFTEEEPGTIQIILTNKQDTDLNYKIDSEFDTKADNCIAKGLQQEGIMGANSTEILDIEVTCNNIISDLGRNEAFADYYISSTVSFSDELGLEHERTTDAFPFGVRLKPRCSAPDDKNYILYEELPIGEVGWRVKTYYFYVDGVTMDPSEVTFTTVDPNQMVLNLDNPAAMSISPKITFENMDKPDAKRVVQIYGILDHGEFIAYKWCYTE